MKKSITRVLMVATLALSALGASAGSFKIGPIVGVNINRFTTSGSELLSSDNRCGINAGVMAKFTVPLIGIGADLSVMYSRRNAEMSDITSDITGETTTLKYDYIAIPLHLRYDISLPVVGKFVTPGIFTGPNFAFRCSKEIIDDYKANKFNVGWDFGLAFTFVDHLQVAASYTLGINKAVEYVPTVNIPGADINGRTDGWAISVAYLF